MNVIADVAGQLSALKRLMDKMPKEEFLFVGDLVDRGPDSKGVLDLVGAGKHRALIGNHEHMMLDYLWAEPENSLYESDIWLYNGGVATMASYGAQPWEKHKVDQDHLVLIGNMPLHYEDEKIFVSHGPWRAGIPKEKALLTHTGHLLNEASVLWNRGAPMQRDQLQLFGHNSHWGTRYFGEYDRPWAICLDASRMEVLTGLHVPTMTIYQEAYDE